MTRAGNRLVVELIANWVRTMEHGPAVAHR
jgi:hypothetical protein